MVIDTSQSDRTHFLVKRSKLTTSKIFVEFYLPEYQGKLDALSKAPYPLKPLRKVASRLFDGPFGSNRKVDMYQDNGIPYIRVKDVLSTGINLSEITYISEEKHQELYRSRVVPGNVLITIAGRVGTAAVFPNELKEGNITGHIAGIELSQGINPNYVAAFLNSRLGEFQVVRLSHRTTRPEMNLKEVGSILVSIPPRSLQDEIAQVMQEAYSKRQKKIEEAESLVKGIDNEIKGFLEVVIGEIHDQPKFVMKVSDLENRWDFKVYDKRYVTVVDAAEKGKYPILRLGKLCREKPKRGCQPQYSPDGIIPVLKTVNVGSGYINFDTALRVAPAFLERLPGRNSKVFKGDVLITSTGDGSWGRASVFEEEFDCVVDGHVSIVRLEPEHNPHFLAEFLNSSLGQAQFWQRYRGATGQTEIYPDDISALKIATPPRQVQDKIARRIQQLRYEAKQLRSQAEAVVTAAKARVERMILGEAVEAVDESA